MKKYKVLLDDYLWNAKIRLHVTCGGHYRVFLRLSSLPLYFMKRFYFLTWKSFFSFFLFCVQLLLFINCFAVVVFFWLFAHTFFAFVHQDNVILTVITIEYHIWFRIHKQKLKQKHLRGVDKFLSFHEIFKISILVW